MSERRFIEWALAFCIVAVLASWAFAIAYSRRDQQLRRQAAAIRLQACQRSQVAYRRENLIEHRQEEIIGFLIAANASSADPVLRDRLLHESELIRSTPPMPIPIPECRP